MDILIPCKSLDAGKSRLSGYLDNRRRRTLCKQLLTKTLENALSLVPPAQIHIVTADPEAVVIANREGIHWIHDPGGGLNAALEVSRNLLLTDTRERSALLILPTDLPYASADAIGKVIACAGEVVIAPDEIGTGTNLLLLRHAALQHLPFCYGPNSAMAHHKAARSLGLDVVIVKDQRLAFDVDGPAQYAAWRAQEAAL